MWYTEEMELLLEEMHQVLAFLKWDQDQWNKQVCHVPQRADSITDSPTPWPSQRKTSRVRGGSEGVHFTPGFCVPAPIHDLHSTAA